MEKKPLTPFSAVFAISLIVNELASFDPFSMALLISAVYEKGEGGDFVKT